MATKSSPPEIIRVAIIEDTRPLREGLSILIGGTPGFECTAKFATMEEALAQIGLAAPDVALVGYANEAEQALAVIGTHAGRGAYPVLAVLPGHDADFTRSAAAQRERPRTAHLLVE